MKLFLKTVVYKEKTWQKKLEQDRVMRELFFNLGELKFIGYGEGTKKGRTEDGEKEDYWVKGNFKGGKKELRRRI